jgi:hypothetical protein
MKMNADTGRVIAGCFALAAFAVAIIAGISAGKDAAQVLLHAVIAMMLCYPVGLVAGMVCDREVRAHIEAEGAALAPRSESSEAPSAATASSLPGQEVADPSREESRAAA